MGIDLLFVEKQRDWNSLWPLQKRWTFENTNMSDMSARFSPEPSRCHVFVRAAGGLPGDSSHVTSSCFLSVWWSQAFWLLIKTNPNWAALTAGATLLICRAPHSHRTRPQQTSNKPLTPHWARSRGEAITALCLIRKQTQVHMPWLSFLWIWRCRKWAHTWIRHLTDLCQRPKQPTDITQWPRGWSVLGEDLWVHKMIWLNAKLTPAGLVLLSKTREWILIHRA